ncbi:hypothetical protein J5N97_017488 [Dioscorea zingiberensis]|uniref:Pentatricopeptide repeat-containing protein n=1 Tax=Dioscorea zingiberensis TaxID=325984 RepID=A0A9D5CLB4_9LILI|nr:hypothetical protein J5N97_017488 [Dioscorea zingiberensis]
MYAKCGHVGFAEFVFETLQFKDLACWNAMVEGFAINGCGCDAIITVSLMHYNGFIANQFTYISALKGYKITGNLSSVKQIHAIIVCNGFEYSTSTMNVLTDTYSRNGVKDSALKAFGRTKDKDIVSWNTVISCIAQDEDPEEVVALFSELLISGLKPNEVTLSIIFRLCGFMDDLSLGSQFCCFTFHLGLFNDMLVLGIQVDDYICSTILSACQGPEDVKSGEEIHAYIFKSGFSRTCIVSSAMTHAYSRFGSVESSLKVFEDTEVLDMVSWGTMISAFSKQGFTSKSLSLINYLRGRGENLDEFMLGSALNACANVAAFNQYRCIHIHVLKTGYERHRKFDAVLSHHGLIERAVEFFEKMKYVDIYPSHATFVEVISACNHLGLAEERQLFFNCMITDYGMSPSKDNLTCLVDLLARNGLLEKARDVIEPMPFEPWPSIWRSLLKGSRIHGNKAMLYWLLS